MTEETEFRWTTLWKRKESYSTGARQKRKPAAECPNCGRYKLFRYRKEAVIEEKKDASFLFFNFKVSKNRYEKWGDIWEKCKNCQYRKQIQEESDSE